VNYLKPIRESEYTNAVFKFLQTIIRESPGNAMDKKVMTTVMSAMMTLMSLFSLSHISVELAMSIIA
jgi:hypothetical protein